METDVTTLIERLHRCGVMWTDAHNAAPTRLGRIVVNDGGLLQRIAQPGASVTIATLEKFAAFLADPANWPEGAVPQEALDLAHVTGVSPAGAAMSPGKACNVSPGTEDTRSAA